MKFIKSLFKLAVSVIRFAVIVGLMIAIAYFADNGQAKVSKVKSGNVKRTAKL